MSSSSTAPAGRSSAGSPAAARWYISEAGSANLPKYRYKGSDNSLIYRHFCSPLAEALVRRAVPVWLAPNAITCSGLVPSVLGHAVIWYHCGDLRARCPAWCWAFSSVCTFVYQTLDNMDGKQARRTGSSSPLGLLLDHSADALNIILSTLNIMAMFQVGGLRWHCLAIWLGSTTPFFFATWEDPERAQRALRVVAGAAACGVVASVADLCPATWFMWSFLVVHLIGVIFLTDYAQERGLLVLCATFGLHGGVALSEWLLWCLGRDGADSVGPWSILVFFACVGYLQNFWLETTTLPPDYINSISLWFPMFPAYNAAVALSCAELFLEWRYFPEYKIWTSCVVLGVCCMAGGQALIWRSCRTAGRNAWASCRNMPEDEEKPEDFVGLEIPDRRIVQEGAFSWERHPTYLGVMLWGVGAEIALCNPVMLLIVGFVLWASLLYVALEEEQELYDEFRGSYANYAALTYCWIPLFNSFLENGAFQREMSDNAEEPEEDVDEDLEEDEDDLEEEEDAASEDDLLPTWEGVPKGGALWNRQFRDPWMLG